MNKNFRFTFKNLRDEYKKILDHGYEIITCNEIFTHLNNNLALSKLSLVNRVDIDFSVKKAERLGEIFDELDIKASFFIRLHANEYNPFSFENYRVIKSLINAGHEIGYHSEVIDCSSIWDEEAAECLKRDIHTINCIFNTKISGVASHGGFTENNNLDFWKQNKPEDFDLLYEAYTTKNNFNLFNNSVYVSDSEWTRWKSYKNGNLLKDENSPPSYFASKHEEIIYLLIHSDTYFDNHFYE